MFKASNDVDSPRVVYLAMAIPRVYDVFQLHKFALVQDLIDVYQVSSRVGLEIFGAAATCEEELVA